MKKKFTLLLAAFALLTTVILPLRMVGQTYSEVLTLNCAYASQNGSSTLYGTGSNTTMTAAGIKTFLKVAANESTETGDDVVSGDVTKTGDVYWSKGSGGTGIPSDVLKLGKASGPGGISFTILNTYDDIKKVSITGYGWKTSTAVAVNGSDSQSPNTAGTEVTFDYVLTSATKTISIEVTSSAFCITEIVLYKESGGGGSTPVINASNQSIDYDATSGSIPYTISNPTSATLSATCTESWVSNIAVTGTEVTFNTTANTANTARTATFTLSYTGATDKTVTVTQAAAPVIYTTIPDLFAAASSTAANVSVTFNNWVVSGVSTNGKNIFVTDNNGNGFIIYYNSNMSGTFSAGKVLSGTAVPCSLTLYNGSAELLNLDASNLTITDGGTVSVANINMADLAGVNTGALVSYENLTCSVNNNKYYLSDGTTTIQVYNTLYSFGSTLEDGKIYNITGVYQQFNTTKEVLPRSANDIVEVTTPDPELTISVTSLTGFTYTYGSGPSAAQSFTVSGSDLTANVTVTAPNNFQVCLTETGTYSASLDITASGTLAATTVYVRLASGLDVNSNYSGDLTVASTGATSKTVALSGSVTEMPVVETPTFTPAEGTYTSAQNVTIACATTGATIRYTLDGTDPTESSTVYSTAIAISATTTVKAKAFKSGCTPSAVAEATYTINIPTPSVATDYTLITDVSGLVAGEKYIIVALNGEEYDAMGKQNTNNRSGLSVTNSSNVITVAPATSATDDAPFEFTLGQDGNNWTLYDEVTGGYLYAASSSGNQLKTQTTNNDNGIWSITFNADSTAEVIAQGGNTHNNMRFNPNNGNPVFSCYAATSNVSTRVSLYKAGDIPTTPTLTVSTTALSDLDYVSGYGPSTAQSFTVSGSNLTENVTVTAPTNFEICLTETGSYANSLTLNHISGVLNTTTVYVRLAANLSTGDYSGNLTVASTGATNKTVALSGSVTAAQTVATPTFTPAEGTYTEAQNVTIACTTDGATIYYTLDGSDPTDSSTEYTAAIAISTTTTVKAKAFKTGYTASAVASATYTINITPPTPGTATDYALITNANDLVAGEKYIIVGLKDTDYMALGKQRTNNRGAADVTIVSNVISVTPATAADDDAPFEFTLGQANGHWTLYDAVNGGYLYAASSESNHLKVQADNDANGEWAITFNTDGTAEVIAQGANTRSHMRFNSNNNPPVFSCYAETSSVVTRVSFFKAGDAPTPSTDPTLTASTETLSGFHYVINEGPSSVQSFVITGSNLTDDVMVTVPADFEISDAEDGTYATALTLPLTNGAINDTVYVRLAAGLDEGNFADTLIATSDTLSVSVVLNGLVTLYPIPVLIATPSSVTGLTYDFEEAGPSNEVDFVLEGSNLQGQVHVYPSEHFMVSTFSDTLFVPENPAVISAATGSFFDIHIYVRMVDSLPAGTYTEQLTLATLYADTMYVNVTGIVTGGTPPTPPTPPTPTGDGDYVRISSLSELVDGSQVIIASRYNSTTNAYEAAQNTLTNNKLNVTPFVSATNTDNAEIIPASIVDIDTSYYWTVGVEGSNYTFTNFHGDVLSYNSGTNFNWNGENDDWNIEYETAVEGSLVPGHQGFVVRNVSTLSANTVRALGMQVNESGDRIGAYAASNMSSATYNFYLDFFVKTEGSSTPTVATPTFSPEAGTYTEAQTVTISCATDSVSIYYTLDGTAPDSTSLLYSTPLNISTTTTVKAIAMKAGYNNSAVASATYTIQAGTAIIFNQDWEGDWNGWTQVSVAGDSTWRIKETSGNHYAYMNAYQDVANEDWLISPAFNLNEAGNATLTFRTARKYTGPDIEVFFSNNYNGSTPSTATWQPLTCTLSTGNNWNWAESGNISLGSFSGTNCYIGFKYTSTDTQAAGWEVDDIMLVGETTDPVINATPLALNGFTYTEGNGPSAEQSFSVSALNLTANLTITAPTNFEISTATGSNFNAQSPITLTPANGTVEATTIYVRMKANLAVGAYEDENIVIASTGATTVNVVCDGEVTTQPQPGSGNYVRIAALSDLANGDKVILAARYNETANAYLAAANTLTSGKLGTTAFNSTMDGTDEIIPEAITGSENEFYWTVGVTADGYTFTNADGQTISYSSQTNFNFTGDKTAWNISTATAEDGALVPNYTGFNIVNVDTENRAFALRVTESASLVGAYSTSNMNNAEYNFFLDIFRQGEGGTPVTPTVATPTFSPAAGTYYGTQIVTISCATEGATIYYSTESATGEWIEYEGPITVDESMTIWAYAELDGYNNSTVASATYVIQANLNIIFNQDWEGDWNGWTQVSVIGDEVWTISSYQGNHYAYMNGYTEGSAHANEDWLISPAFNLNSYTDVVLTFRTAKNFNGEDIVVLFSNDYDGQNPNGATWETITCPLSTGSWNWVESGAISMDGFSGENCYIAYKYTSTDELAAGWEVDDIMLTSGNTGIPSITATPDILADFEYDLGEGPSESQAYILTSANLEGQGTVSVTVTDDFEISLDNAYFSSAITLEYANGVITNQPLTVYVRMAAGLEAGIHTGTITHTGGGASATVALTGYVYDADQPVAHVVMPMYIQGNNGTNNNRVPVAMEVFFYNLEPNTTYRYTNQLVDINDGPESAGAGNVIYANNNGFYRSTSPSLSTEGGYGVFTTNDNGGATVWCLNEPTANARFTPGNQVYMRIRINDGNEGTTVSQIFTSEDYATVLNFGNGRDEYQGTAFIAKSDEAPMGFAMMYANTLDERPIYATSIETTGVEYASINQYADFYKDEVAGNNGWFGGILPNDNEIGINAIWIMGMDGGEITFYGTENGFWQPEGNTVNPNGGLDTPIFIDLTYDGVEEAEEANVTVWSTGHEFVIENGDNSHYVMTVYNVLGQPMMQRQINAGSSERISHSLASGLYIINLQNNHNKVATKVIVR